MKKKTRKVLLGAATLAAISGIPYVEVDAATNKHKITARIIAAIDINEIAVLNFGTITVGGADKLQLKTDGSRTSVGGKLGLVGTAHKQGKFEIVGGKDASFKVTAATKASITNATAQKMKVTAFRFGTASGSKLTAKLTAVTKKTYALGATLNVGAAQATGTYKGTVTLTAVYQ